MSVATKPGHTALTVMLNRASSYAVDFVKENPSESGEMAPVYGMAATLPFRGVVRDFLKQYLDIYYKV